MLQKLCILQQDSLERLQMETFGLYLQRCREKLTLFQREIAKQVGVSQPTIATWENDRSLPDRNKLEEVGEVYNADLNLLQKLYKRRENANILPLIRAILDAQPETLSLRQIQQLRSAERALGMPFSSQQIAEMCGTKRNTLKTGSLH